MTADPRPASGATGGLRRVAVFCASSLGNDPRHREAARALAGALADRGLGLVFGGGKVGLMGVVADEMLIRGGEVIGVIPQSMVEREVAHHGTDLRIVSTMHERKALMYDLADAVVALPGGYGTLDELFEVLTWNQLRLHALPTGLLDVGGYFEGLIRFLDGATDAGLLKPAHRAVLHHHHDPHQLLEALSHRPDEIGDKWS